jgi:hypothetical protein
VLREEIPDCLVIVGSVFYRKRPRGISVSSYKRRKNRVNKFLFREFGAFEQGKKVFFSSPTYSLVGTSTVTEYTSMMMMETDISSAAFLQAFDLPVSDCSKPDLRCMLLC